MKRRFENVGRICFKIDDLCEQILRQESKDLYILLFECIRQNLFSMADFGQQKHFLHNENFPKFHA